MPYTSGPWEWEIDDKDDWGDQGPNLRSIALGRVWDEYWGPDGNGVGKDRANMPPSPLVLSAWGHDAWGINVDPDDMKLIAAAPELLEYVQSSASSGCATAKELLARLALSNGERA